MTRFLIFYWDSSLPGIKYKTVYKVIKLFRCVVWFIMRWKCHMRELLTFKEERRKLYGWITNFFKGRNLKFTDLVPYKIGVGRGYANTEEFDAADYLKKEEATDTTTNIRKLLKGRIDLMIDSKKVVRNILNKHFPKEKDAVSVVEPALQSRGLHIGFSKAIPNHKEIVNNSSFV